MLPIRRPQDNRPVNARAGVPAGVGLVGVAGDDLQGIFLPRPQLPRQLHIEVGVAVGPESQLFPVEPHLGVVVHALKLQHSALIRQRSVRRKNLGVEIVPPLVPAGIDTPGGQLRPGLRQHGVVGEADGNARRPFPQVLYLPVVIKLICFHLLLPPTKRSGSQHVPLHRI